MRISRKFPRPSAVMAVALVASTVVGAVASKTGTWPLAAVWVGAAGLMIAAVIHISTRGQQKMAVLRNVSVVHALARRDYEAAANESAGDDDVGHALTELADAALADYAREQQTSRQRDLQRRSLAGMTVGVMVTESRGEIVFVNHALAGFLARIEADVRATVPDFHGDSLIGQDLHMLDSELDLTTSGVAQIDLGSKQLKLSITALEGPEQSQFGAVVVWEDRTEELSFEHDMETILSSAVQGDLSQRVDVTQQTGFSRRMADSVNALLDLAESITNDTLRIFGAMAGGDLSQTIDIEYQGAFERLKQDANSSMRRLAEVLVGIQQSAEAVSTAFREINHGNMNLSQRTEQQASSLEETASSMEEMTGTVQKNADNAQEANQLALKAREQAEKGGDVVGDAVGAMTEINEASRRIADIISVIDDIAFQTNLLALNASVEAARAGEQGRGFAVVAGEVRNLAGRSAEAAKEIKGLIEDSVSKVARGSQLVDESGRTLESIVDRIKQVAEIVAEISTASLEQATGISQVNSTIAHMDNMTQQNAALVEEVSAASELAGEQAARLQKLVSFFGGDGERTMPLAAGTDEAPGFVEVPIVPVVAEAPAQRAANADFDADWEEF